MTTDPNPLPQPTTPPKLESKQDSVRALLKNSVFYLGSDTIIKLLSFIFNIYVVRQLGGERFGQYSAALAYAGIFSIIGDLGMTQYAGREIARGRKTADELFWNLVVIRLGLSTVATIFIVTSAVFVASYGPDMVLGIFLVCLGFYLHAFLGPINIILTGKERVDYAATLDTIVQICFVTAGTWVLVNGFNFYSLIIASYIGIPAAILVGAIYVKRLKLASLKFQLAPGQWLPILKYSFPFALITFTLLVGQDIDTVFLSLWRSPEEVGWYKAAYNLIYKLLFIRGALLSTLVPQMSRYYGVSKPRVGKIFNAAFKILWAFSFPIAIGTSLLAQPIITWLYTDEFAQSAIVLAILIWALPLLNLSSLCGSVTTATDQEKKAMRVYIAAAILNVAVNLIAIPIWGYIGAAVATLMTEAIALVLFYSVLHREFPLTDLKNTLMKPFIAGLIMAGIILLISSWPLLIIIPIGAFVYVTTLLIMKPFNPLEIELLQDFWLSLQRKLGWSV